MLCRKTGIALGKMLHTLKQLTRWKRISPENQNLIGVLRARVQGTIYYNDTHI